MRTPARHAAALGLILACMVTGWGCRTLTGERTRPATTYQLKRVPPFNTWEATVTNSIEATHKAVLEGLEDLGIEPITNRVDKLSGTVDALFADQMDLEVKLHFVAPEMTRIRIRCGIVGHEQRTEQLFRAFEKHL
ncbi:MAG: DUF3568 family protein [Lentisphaerae bacterium]|jgi:hypothetical protein|nr:DUF3568 family protein [Lentisphaerota bacterium]MBT4816486.1 DUF3568 family protein [Lentisphaerota bacterium]MBT5612834.1 DUF3568 family protein [Lentisphaerota bacterium]MBT7059840.1 DUF3568 family protein [Lentisphaerota bacterium]MBT7846080.1 DUF3568 family protein [Lentisphaerota bacterium]